MSAAPIASASLDPHARHAVQRPVPHGEYDAQPVAVHDALVVGLRVPVSLGAQVLLDAYGRVLEEILVNRRLALHRHELGELLRRQRVVLDRDGDERPRTNVIVTSTASPVSDSSTAASALAS